MIQVHQPGLHTTVQDLGRHGQQRHGIVVGGVLDPLAMRVLNLLLSNEPNAAVLEFAALGPALHFGQDTLIAWSGGGFRPKLSLPPAAASHESPAKLTLDVPAHRPVLIAAGSRLAFGPAHSGLRAWLGIAGGIAVPSVLGSRSTYALAELGGHQGRALRAGDALPLGQPSATAQQLMARLKASAALWPSWLAVPERLLPTSQAIRVLRGPEWAWFTEHAQQTFLAAEWQTTARADRMGCELRGPALELVQPRELLSSGIAAGTVQVPRSGQPFVLLADRQTVGGYPRLASIATVDQRRFAQLVPGESLRFELITSADAHALLAEQEHALQTLACGLARLADKELSPASCQA